MIYWVIALASFLTSLLTLFSGFGLGTILLPVFALFFPVDLAVALTAFVHFLNNLFKLCLLGRHAKGEIVLKFGMPAIFSAFVGAKCLVWFSKLDPLYRYSFYGHRAEVTALKLVIAFLMTIFSILEILPAFKNLAFEKRHLPLGGILSGFFGGLSGHQGALRSAFLVRTGLSKENFIGTGVMIAVFVDITRLLVYGSKMTMNLKEQALVLSVAVLSAFLGAWTGNRILKKITLTSIQMIVAVLLFIIAGGLAFGII